MLETQRYTVLFGIELEDLGSHFVAHGQHFGRVTNTAPGQIGNVQQAIDTAEVNEGTIVSDVLDDALDNSTLLQGFKQLLTIFTHVLFKNSTTRQHNVVTLAIELDDLELHGLAFERRSVLNWTGVDQRTRQEGANAVHHNSQTTLHLAGDGAGNQRAVVQSSF